MDPASHRPDANPPTSDTLPLLQRWHAGDRAALDQLIEQEFTWIRNFAKRRIGKLLRHKGDVDDYVHDALVQVLDYVPRFLVADRRQFRALLGRFCENAIRDRVEYHRTQKRNVDREREIPRDTVLELDPTGKEVTRVSVSVDRNADAHWLRLAVELLDPPVRRLILMRDWDRMSFAEIAAELGISEDAARMRYQRVLPNLAIRVEELRRGELANALKLPDDPDIEGSEGSETRDASGLQLSAAGAHCWEMLDAIAEGNPEARKVYLRLCAAVLMPAVESALRCRWGDKATKEDIDTAVLELTEPDRHRQSLTPQLRARGFAVFLEQLVDDRAASAETRAPQSSVTADREAQRSAFETTWAGSILTAATREHRTRATTPEQRFRARLLQIRGEEEVGFAELTQRWSIPEEDLVSHYAAARAEVVEVIAEFVRFFAPDQTPQEVAAEAGRCLALAASAAR